MSTSLLGIRTLLLTALALLWLAPSVGVAQEGSRCDAPSRSLDELLNPDGSLKGDPGYEGSIDARGWRITTAPDGSPRFVRSDTASLSAASVPDDIYWSDFALPGTNGAVEALAMHDGTLFMGGSFTKAGGLNVGRVAMWNSGTYQWTAPGAGVNGTVYAIAVDDRDLFVAGVFSRAGEVPAANIARYDRQSGIWSALGTGITSTTVSPSVRALAIVGDSLYVGGRFNTAGGKLAASLAVWNRRTSEWFPMGTGVTGDEGTVFALLRHGDTLFIGGAFSTLGGRSSPSIGVFRISDGGWFEMRPGVAGQVRALVVDGRDLYIGGDFSIAGGFASPYIVRFNLSAATYYRVGDPGRPGQNYGMYNPVYALAATREGIFVGGVFDRTGTNIFVRKIALWNRTTWKTVGGGVVGPRIGAMASDGDRVYVAGEFVGGGDRVVNYVGVWSGGNWAGLANAPDNGVNGVVHAMAVDGSDLFVGGEFTVAAGRRMHRVARWNGLQWQSLTAGGADLDGPVRAIAVTPDAVYVGGDFNVAGGVPAARVARWNRSTGTWGPLGAGIRGQVRALAVSGTRLYAGGIFDSAGTVRARNIAMWDGSGWSALGSGVNNGAGDTVQAIVADGDEVFVGGYFLRAGDTAASRIARWNHATQTWLPLGEGVTGSAEYRQAVYAMALQGRDLYVGGEFTRAGGQVANYVAKWNRDASRWDAIDTGSGRGVCNTVFAILPVGSELYVAGKFVIAGAIGTRNVAHFDGRTWRALGRGANNGTDNYVFALARLAGELYVGGRFSMAGGMRANQVARWDGTNWYRLGGDPQLGVDGVVRAIALAGDEIYVGGLFLAAGDAASSRVARFNRKTGVWTMLGGGTDGPVFAIAVTPTDVYVGGRFSKAGAIAANNIARWSRAAETWFPLGPPGDDGTDGEVFALAVDETAVYVGGAFTTAGLTTVRNLASWDIAESEWRDVGGGTDGNVNALGLVGRDLFVGGDFSSAGGQAFNFIARHNLASGLWLPLQTGVSGIVQAIGVHGSRVYIGGEFTTAGAVQASHIVAWDMDRSRFIQLGRGVSGGSLTSVSAIAASGQSLYVGGSFLRAGDSAAEYVAHYNVVTGLWSPLGSGVGTAEQPWVHALAYDGAALYVGGSFARAGDKLSLHFARWNKAFTGAPPGPSPGSLPGLAVRPQPATDRLEVVYDLPSDARTRISLVTADGRPALSILDAVREAGRHSLALDVSALPSGVYLLMVRTADGTSTQTVVVTR